MQLTEVRINLCPGGSSSRLKAFCSLTFDQTFVVRDVKLIEGNGWIVRGHAGSEDHRPLPALLREKSPPRRFCNQCGNRLDPDRAMRHRQRQSSGQCALKLHADIAHPINAELRRQIEAQVVAAYQRELDRSRQPGYVAPSLDAKISISMMTAPFGHTRHAAANGSDRLGVIARQTVTYDRIPPISATACGGRTIGRWRDRRIRKPQSRGFRSGHPARPVVARFLAVS